MFTSRARLILCSSVISGSIVVFGTMTAHPSLTPMVAALAIRPSSSFEERLSFYTRLRQHIIKAAPQSQDEGDEWTDPSPQRALARAIQVVRRDAQPGDVFGSEEAQRIRQAIRIDMTARGGPDRQAVLSEVPLSGQIHVNDYYPDGAPLATMPPLLLMHLAPLPPELQYRFLGDAVILLDIDTNLIVDVIPHVISRRS